MSTDDSLTLTEAATRYLADLAAPERQEGQQEITKFIRWCGADRLMSQLTAREIANYAEGMGTSTADPLKKLAPIKAFLAYAKRKGLTGINLGVHLRVKKGASVPGVPANVVPRQAITLTREGHQRMQAELAALKEERPRIAQELRDAWLDKDVRENAPLDAAKERQGQVEARIRELEAVLKAATILEKGVRADTARAELGSRVTVRDLASNEELKYTLVSPNEVDPARGRVSVVSPIGKALLDRSSGEVVEVIAPVGTMRYRIEAIEH